MAEESTFNTKVEKSFLDTASATNANKYKALRKQGVGIAEAIRQVGGTAGYDAAVAAAKASPDKLDEATLAKMYGYAMNIISNVPEINSIFKDAVAGQWSDAQFQAKLQSSTWWEENDQYARKYITAKAAGGADWAAMQTTARNKIKIAAAAVGRQLTPQELETYADLYMSQGWGDPDRAGMLKQALSEGITAPKTGVEGVSLADTWTGAAGTVTDALKSIAVANGLKLSDDYFLAAAKSVGAGLSSPEDWIRDVRSQAASLYPLWADKIMAGTNARTLASGYINTIAQTFEIDPNTINLDDPYLKQAFGQTNDKNEPMAMGLWDFQKVLRKDPRFQQTQQYQNEMSDVAHSVLQTFGFMGG